MRLAQRGRVSMALIIALLASTASLPAGASWLGRLLGEAGEAGGRVAGRAAREAAQGLDGVARHVQALPPLAKGEAVLAAHVGHEGHWTFVNRAGERFTAGTREELQRVTRTLLPSTPEGPGTLRLVLSEDAVFSHAVHMTDLPEGARLELLSGGRRYRLHRDAGAGGTTRFSAALTPNVSVALTARASFVEMAALMARPLDPKRVRVLSLEPGGPQTLKPRAAGDGAGRPLPEAVDPFKLAGAFSSLQGQTALVSGRIEGAYLKFKPGSGPEQTLLLADLKAAAARHDVDLVLLQSARAEQPGARNWLYQTVAVSGLDTARRPLATLGDLVESVAERRGRMIANVGPSGGDRAAAKMTPAAPTSAVSPSALTEWFDEVVQNITGNVVTIAIDLDTRSRARTSELDARIVPGIPSGLQFGYIVLVVMGLMGLGYARRWWQRVWPAEARGEYGSVVGYGAARGVRLVAFLLVFLPLVGGPAFLISLLDQALGILLLPVRALQWMFGRWRRAEG